MSCLRLFFSLLWLAISMTFGFLPVVFASIDIVEGDLQFMLNQKLSVLKHF